MKNSEVNDPLNEKVFSEKEPETKTKEPVKEENDPTSEKVAQEHQRAPGENAVAKSDPRTNIPPVPENDGSAPEPEESSSGDEPLIDDQEEQTINGSSDDDLDHDDDQEEEHPNNASLGDDPEQDEDSPEGDEVESEEEEPKLKKSTVKAPEAENDTKAEEEERVNFSLLSQEDLVKLLREKLDHPGKGNIRKDVNEIKQAFFEKLSESLEEKKKKFLEEGGAPEDFKPVEDPLEGEMKELLHKYRGLKAEFTRQLEKTKVENLSKKQEILEQFRVLMEGQEPFESTFRKFKELQKEWFSVGVIPQQNLKDLWDSYNYFVDKFNDYVRINRELRALDLKKNLELKIQLCEKTEQLDMEPNVVVAFKSLQKFHARWRDIGPVPRENRDEIWERFKNATSAINRKHQEYHSMLKDSLHENLEKKTALCESVEEIAGKVYENHGEWVDRTNQVLEIQKTWKTIGYAPKKDNNAIYSRFRKACDTFFSNKAKFYASAYEEQKQNMRLKLEITEQAEALSDSEDWKETTTELIRLQKQWKEIGPVPRRESDKLWRRFRAACDSFFNNKSKYFEDIDSTFEDNLKAKEALLAEMDAFKPGKDRKKNMEILEDFQTRFYEIGYVPSNKKDWIKEEFRMAHDRVLERMGMDDSERSIFKFRHRVQGMVNAPRSEMKLNFERDKLVNKLQQLKNDIGVWENNIGFFKQSDSSEETISGFNEKIESARERIRVLEEKIRLIDDMENEN